MKCDYTEHATWLYRDCVSDGWGIFRIAETYTAQEGKQTWTEPELITAIAVWLYNETANDTKQRPAEIQHPANPGSQGPTSKPDGSAVSVSGDMQLHGRTGPDIRKPGKTGIRPGHITASSQPASAEAVAIGVPGSCTQTIQRPKDNNLQG